MKWNCTIPAQTERHYLPQGRGLRCRSCNRNPRYVLEYSAVLDPRLLREVGYVKDRGKVSWNRNEVCDFLWQEIQSRLITWLFTWHTCTVVTERAKSSQYYHRHGLESGNHTWGSGIHTWVSCCRLNWLDSMGHCEMKQRVNCIIIIWRQLQEFFKRSFSCLIEQF